MNKLKKILLRSFTTSLLLCSLIFCSACSGFLTDNIWVSDSSTVLGSGFVRLRATILNYNKITSDELISESSPSARSINPVMASQNYAFYLYGQKSSDMQNIGIGPSKINQISDTTGEFSMDIPKGIWVLTLVAVKDEPGLDLSNLTKIKQNALLWGSTVCDYTNDSSPVNFILAPDGLSTKGTATIDIALSGWTVSDHIGVTGDNLENIKVKAGIYRYNKTGAERIVAEEIFTFTNNGSADKYTFAPKDTADSSKDLEISPGSYEFIVSFYEEVSYTDPDTSETTNYTIREWVWSDQINIFPGRETSTTVKIPKLVSEPPAAPSNFSVTPLTLNSDNISADGYMYACRFEWQDNASTETGFEIRLTDDADSEYEEIYSTDVITKKYYYIEDSGDLDSITGTGTNGSVSLRIPFGRKIKAQIRAVNQTGPSAWVDYTNTAPINRYIVTFHFNGGKTTGEITLGNNSGTVQTNTELTQYTFYGPSNDLTLQLVKDTDKEKITRTDNSEAKFFDSWGTDPISTVSYTDNPFTTRYQNIDLWAQYKTETVVQEEEKLQDRLKNYFTIGGSKPDDNAFSKDKTTLRFTNGSKVTTKLTNKSNILAGSSKFEYTHMDITICDIAGNTVIPTKGADRITSWGGLGDSTITIELTLDSSKLTSGTKYSMVIEATTSDNQVIPSVIYFTVN